MKTTLLRLVMLALATSLGVACSDDDTPAPKNNNNIITPDMSSDAGEDATPDSNNEEDMGPDATDPDMDTDMEQPSCEDDCQVGEQVCDSDGTFRICGQFDLDECVEFSQPIACATGHSCQIDRCVPPCRDECASGSTVCLDENTVGTCGNFDADACLEAGAPVTCDAGDRCEQGACVDEAATCTDECSTGEAVCSGDSVRSCGQYDSDTCLDLGPPAPCASGEECNGGVCGVACTDTCSAEGAEECSGNGVRTCERVASGCLAWSAAIACQANESCSNGECSANCADECPTSGAALCSPDATAVSVCGQFDQDTCLDRSTPVPCPSGYSCDQGACVATCNDECTQGATQCSGNSLETCGNFDADPCLEWGGAVACPGGATCSNNTCDLPCSDECTAGAEECSGNGVRSCGQFDLDSCLEWSSVTNCQSYEVCSAATCELGPTPAIVLINEVVYDSNGTDSAAGNNLFIELKGPASQSLDGFTVVGVNGSGGGDYNPIQLTGEVIGTDGYFLIAHPNGAPALVAQADITSNSVDLQNGPDSLQIRWRGRVVDALGYGTFGANDTFAGEGDAAASTPQGSSLSRDLDSNDSDDNATDFTVQATPTPRAATVSCSNECATGESRCDGTQIQMCGDFDADTCLEWGPSMACSGTQVCQGNTCQDPCTNECPSQGATECAGIQVRTCGNFDTDSCLEWSTPANCPGSNICSVNACQDATAPEVVLIAPQGTLQTTQGNVHRILVDATPFSGRQISEVRYYANGSLLASTTATPHEYYYTVPTNHPTNSQIVIQAQATDSTGIVGNSAFAYLDVRNDTPVASFTATITNTTTVTVDASGSTDTETATNNLEVCWDWNNDSTCDTPFSNTLITSHDFGASGNYTVRMVVRDAVGQTSSTTRQISFADIQYIGGQDVTTTLWYGTIIVTGDITVPAGNTLTIAEGTDILFVYADVAAPTGVGDYRITVNGNLIVNGTAANPVIFSGQDATAKVPGGWDRIVLNGANSVINHAIIEYADVGIEAKSNVEITNTEVRNTLSNCIVLDNADNAELTDVLVRECGANGVEVKGGSSPVAMTSLTSQNNGESGMSILGNSVVTATTSDFSNNDLDGVRVATGTLNLSDSVSELNTKRGLAFIDSAVGQITRNQIRSNGGAGVTLLNGTSANPNPIITLNNIYSNSTVGGETYETLNPSATLSASFGCCNATGATSSTWSSPAGSTIRRVRVNYNESDNSTNYVRGFILNGASGAILHTLNADSTAWFLIPEGVNSLRVRVADTGYSGSTDTISISSAEVGTPQDSVDVVASITSTVDMQRNYLGTWPNVLSRINENSTNSLNVQGFVGVPFTSSWDTGIYKSGNVNENWSGTVYITGNTIIPAGSVVNASAGSQILFVNHDQDADLLGDFSITATGALNLNGSVGNEILVAGFGPSDIDMFNTVNLNGSAANTSTWNDVNVRNARNGLTLRGSSELTRVSVTTVGQDAVAILAGSAVLNRVTVDGAGRYGIYVGNATPDINRALVRNNLSDGLYYALGAGGSLEDSTVRDNQGHGIYVNGPSSPGLNYNLITYNAGNGIKVRGNSTSVANYNVIKFNDDSGVSLWSMGTTNPSGTFNYSNIYANAVLGSTIPGSFAPSATLAASFGCCNATGSTSSIYTLPAGHEARNVLVNYNESDNSTNYVRGFVIDGTTGAILHTLNSDTNTWLAIPDGVTALRVRVVDTGYSGSTDTISITTLETVDTTGADNYELTSATRSGTSEAKFNYWTPTIGAVPTKIFQSRNGEVDYSGFTGAEYPSGPVTEIGPRP